jgi:hypothetical protein
MCLRIARTSFRAESTADVGREQDFTFQLVVFCFIPCDQDTSTWHRTFEQNHMNLIILPNHFTFFLLLPFLDFQIETVEYV